MGGSFVEPGKREEKALPTWSKGGKRSNTKRLKTQKREGGVR